MQVSLIHAVAWVNGSFLFIAENLSSVWTCHGLSICFPSTGTRESFLTAEMQRENLECSGTELAPFKSVGNFRVSISSKLLLVQIKEGNGPSASFLENRICVLWPAGHLGDHMTAAFLGSREGTSLRRAPEAELRGRLGRKVDPHPEPAGQGFGARHTAGWEVPAWSLRCCVTRETS